MKGYSQLVAFCLLMVGCSDPHLQTLHYIGHHYGDHPSWEYYTELDIVQSKDTLLYGRNVYSRASIKNPAYPIESQRIMAVADKNRFAIVYDSLDYNWPGGNHIVKRKSDEGYEVHKNADPRKTFNPKSSNTPILTSYGAAELYLRHTDLHPNYEQDVYLLEDSLRLFRIKVLGTTDKTTYDIAFFSLDGANRSEARFAVNVQTKTTVKREYIIHEKSEGYRSKSIGYETQVDQHHQIDLGKIASPNSNNYMESGFSIINQHGDSQIALALIDSALALDYSWPNVSSKLIALDYLTHKKEASTFINSFLTDNRITMAQAYRIGRDLMLFQSQQSQSNYEIALLLFESLSDKYPEEPLPHFGVARAYSAQHAFGKAIAALEQCHLLDTEKRFAKQIEANLDRLKQRKTMI